MGKGPYAKFGIIDDLDKEQDYSQCHSKEYNCIRVPDDYLSLWWSDLGLLPTMFHHFSRAELGLARWGVTLIPPSSLEAFYQAVSRGQKKYPNTKKEATQLLQKIQQAQQEQKYMIHFGV